MRPLLGVADVVADSKVGATGGIFLDKIHVRVKSHVDTIE
jgi:hypothetical protein